MEGEPQNSASDVTRRSAVLLNDRDFVVNGGLSSLATPGFVRYDRRRVTAQPTIVGADAWLDVLLDLERLTGEWPRYELTKILAVRGERLCASHWVLRFGESAEMEFVSVVRVDNAGERFEVIYFFDPEDVDRAIAELERLEPETGGEGTQPPIP